MGICIAKKFRLSVVPWFSDGKHQFVFHDPIFYQKNIISDKYLISSDSLYVCVEL